MTEAHFRRPTSYGLEIIADTAREAVKVIIDILGAEQNRFEAEEKRAGSLGQPGVQTRLRTSKQVVQQLRQMLKSADLIAKDEAVLTLSERTRKRVADLDEEPDPAEPEADHLEQRVAKLEAQVAEIERKQYL
jgi:hypothetical protein